MPEPTPLDLDAARRRLASKQGAAYWASLEELASDPGFEQLLAREFPSQATLWPERVDRRGFLKLAAASLALAGLAACAPARGKIVPRVSAPEYMVPGRPVFYASAMPLLGYARGVLVETHDGRPTKLEGNPLHPDSLGATDAWTQAAVLTLYDPDRSQTVLAKGAIATWDAFDAFVVASLARWRGGAGLRLVTGTVTSPALAARVQDLLRRYPDARWVVHDPARTDDRYAAASMAFGRAVEPVYHLDRADVILSLDGDFLAHEPGSLHYARDFIDRRRVTAGVTRMNRLYVAESSPTITGAVADHRLALPPSRLAPLARMVAAGLGLGGATPSGPEDAWASAVAADLAAHRGRGVVIAGSQAPLEVQAIAHAINAHLGAPATYVPPLAAHVGKPHDDLATLVADMRAGRVDTLVMLESNPVYDAPADLRFEEALKHVPHTVHLGLYVDETARSSGWHLPLAHFLEAWGDVRAYDGTVSVVQPAIAPLYDGRSALELVDQLAGGAARTGYDVLSAFWTHAHGKGAEAAWERALHDGVVANSAPAPVGVTASGALPAPAPAPASGGLELVFRLDPSVLDGRFAENAWLQELPRPLTKLTWDGAALVSPRTAEAQGLATGDLVELTLGANAVQAPVLVQPGVPDGVVSVPLGYGRRAGGRVAIGPGFDAYRLRTAGALWWASGATMRKLDGHYQLAVVHGHFRMENRDLVRAATWSEFQANPRFAQKDEKPLSLYPPRPAVGENAWAMAIDLTACIGCNACVVACQAENNIPVVGKEQVLMSREMHWLRVDRYYTGAIDAPDVAAFQPVPCMHCEHAPCEVVCPTEATVHSSEGLNEMVYNRCIGTRYCSNNCPYKVRRFNFLKYVDTASEVRKLGRNPDVSVRERGVMEKCTYCVQRIQEAKIASGAEGGQPVIQTACQQACPTRAIVFGDLTEPDNDVVKLKASPLDYGLLTELNTRPRTTYQARVTNPNPALTERAHGT